MDGEGEMKLKTRRGGEWERVGAWWVLVLSSDWLLPLPRNKVLRLVAAPQLAHQRRRRRRDTAGAVIHSCGFFFPEQTCCCCCCCSETANTRLTFSHLQLNNAALTARSGEGLLGFTASVYSHVKGESLGCWKAVSHILGKDTRGVRTWITACWGELSGVIVGIFCVLRIYWMLCCLCALETRRSLSKMRAGGGKSALYFQPSGSSSVCKWTDHWLNALWLFPRLDCRY